MTSFDVKGNALTITYNNGQHATYQRKGMQPGTTFTLKQGTDPWGEAYSTLTVPKASAHKEVAHHNRAPELILPLVGVDAHHIHFGPGPFFG